jgi:hypothetical protein
MKVTLYRECPPRAPERLRVFGGVARVTITRYPDAIDVRSKTRLLASYGSAGDYSVVIEDAD